MWRWLVSRVSQFLSYFQEVKALRFLPNSPRKAKGRILLSLVKKARDWRQRQIEGSTVLAAKTGFYEKPIATLDFASL
ncbi:hypothetical protein IFM89_032887 [Coptis chinensis]|uniref:DNA-directed DNA polymerase n=1 Tax=Coptis chinensis TaxID=261450 RepID=A0A835IU52_9MAGN|nr:hypothetical protein IFM89_032887 [Coptis chinensis]